MLEKVQALTMFENLKNVNVSNIYRKIWLLKWRILLLLVVLMLATTTAVFVIPVRNVVLFSSVKFAWREVPTIDLFRMHFVEENIPDGMFENVTCLIIKRPEITKQDINTSAILTYSHLRSNEAQIRSLKKGHGRYLPALNLSQKVDNLYLYKVAAEALDQVGVRHFLVAGSLLGLKRHGGFVPWDDDLDIGVASVHWKVVKKTLSCIEGFRIWQKKSFHWKFYYKNVSHPYVDIFFYQTDDKYVWADNSYTRKTFIYPTHFVFPLTEDVFEGVRVPVPRDSLAVAKRIYDYDVCAAYNGHIPRNMSAIDKYPDGYLFDEISCKDLTYMYSMHNF